MTELDVNRPIDKLPELTSSPANRDTTSFRGKGRSGSPLLRAAAAMTPICEEDANGEKILTKNWKEG